MTNNFAKPMTQAFTSIAKQVTTMIKTAKKYWQTLGYTFDGMEWE